MSGKFMRDPLRILVKRDEICLDNIDQFSVEVIREEWKLGALMDLYDRLCISQAVVFCNT